MHTAPTLSPEQKEQAQHGEHIFPVKKYTTLLSEPYPAVGTHWHDEAELTLITKGRCTYQVMPETCMAEENDILFLPPAALHSIRVSPGEQMESAAFVFHMNFLGANSADICSVRYLTPIASQTLLLPFHIGKDHPAHGELLSLFRSMDAAYEQKAPGYELLFKARLLETVSALLPYRTEAGLRPALQNEHTSKLKLVLEYIGGHFTEDLTISELAGICYFSEYHFMRFFKKYMGISCLEYIRNLRLEKAAGLLAQGEASIMDAAFSSGFSNLSYFYREFKKKYGMTPKAFSGSAFSSFYTNIDC